jgi:hypothetical protein
MTSTQMCAETSGTNACGDAQAIVYWHRELPPLSAEAMGEHTLEAVSHRVPGTLIHRDELWERCYDDLMEQARQRLQQEVTRLGGNCAHVLNESVDSRHDSATNEAWLHGRFTYVLYREPMKR